MQTFDAIPLWIIFPITVACGVLSVELGYRLARYQQRRSQGEKESPVGSMAGATLGLLAFMMAFTFGLASSRNENMDRVGFVGDPGDGDDRLSRRSR